MRCHVCAGTQCVSQRVAARALPSLRVAAGLVVEAERSRPAVSSGIPRPPAGRSAPAAPRPPGAAAVAVHPAALCPGGPNPRSQVCRRRPAV